MSLNKIPVRSALRAIKEAYSGGNPDAIKEFLGTKPQNKLLAHKKVSKPRGGTLESAWKVYQGTAEYQNHIDNLTSHGIAPKNAFTVAYSLFEAGYKAHKTWQEQQPAAGSKGAPRRRQRP